MQLVFASSNKNKIKEIQVLLSSKIKVLSLDDIDCQVEIPETALTIEGNSILKATYISENYKLNCFADDSGLEIDVLNGEPGVFSARYAGEPKNDANNIQKVLLNLKNSSNRKANFKTVICLKINTNQHLFTGVVEGTITHEPKGTNGFGYDSIFIPNGFSKTFAELTFDEKSQISHRKIAVTKMIDFLKKL